MRSWLLPLTVTALVTLALSACGNKAEIDFVTTANTICEEEYADLANSLARVGLVEDQGERTELAIARADAGGEIEARMTQVEVPAETRQEFDAYLGAQRESLRLGGAGTAEPELEEAGLELGLQICAGLLSTDEQERVADRIEEAFTSTDPDVCAGYFTKRYLNEYFGGEDQCRTLAANNTVESVFIDQIEGSDGEFSSARMAITGGPMNGTVLRVRVLYDEHTNPKINDSEPLAG